MMQCILGAKGKLLAAVAVVAVLGAGELRILVANTVDESFSEYCQTRTAKLKRCVSTIQSSNADDSAIKAFARRIELIEEMTSVVREQCLLLRSASMDAMLNEVMGGTSPPVPKGSASVRKAPRSALNVYRKYRASFSEQLSMPNISAEEREKLESYYDALMLASFQYVAERAGAVDALDPRSRKHTLELILVTAFLRTPDPLWAKDQLATFPKWVCKPEVCKAFEEFALLAGLCLPKTPSGVMKAAIRLRQTKTRSIECPGRAANPYSDLRSKAVLS